MKRFEELSKLRKKEQNGFNNLWERTQRTLGRLFADGQKDPSNPLKVSSTFGEPYYLGEDQKNLIQWTAELSKELKKEILPEGETDAWREGYALDKNDQVSQTWLINPYILCQIWDVLGNVKGGGFFQRVYLLCS